MGWPSPPGKLEIGYRTDLFVGRRQRSLEAGARHRDGQLRGDRRAIQRVDGGDEGLGLGMQRAWCLRTAGRRCSRFVVIYRTRHANLSNRPGAYSSEANSEWMPSPSEFRLLMSDRSMMKLDASLTQARGLPWSSRSHDSTGIRMPSRIEDYALIGNQETVALVARDGSIDWMGMPRFDSPACFSALLGAPEHGRWQVAPVDAKVDVQRAYRDGRPDRARDALLDRPRARSASSISWPAAPAGSRPDAHRARRARGRVAMRTELVVRFDYGSVVPWVSRQKDRFRSSTSRCRPRPASRLAHGDRTQCAARTCAPSATSSVGEGDEVTVLADPAALVASDDLAGRRTWPQSALTQVEAQ